MKYVDVSGSVHIVVGIIGLLWLLCSIYNVVSCIVSRMEKQFVIPSVLLTITACVFNHGLAEAENEPSKMVEIGKMTGSIPVCFIVGMLFLFLGLQLVWDGYIRQKKRKIIMPQTVKQCFDILSDGVGYFSEEGMPFLVNKQMLRLCDLIGDSDRIDERKIISELARRGGRWITQTKDGKIWDFRKTDILIRKHNVQEVVAYDVTEVYTLKKKREQQYKVLQKYNDHLRQFDDEIEQTVVQKEILLAKMKIHDDIGSLLIAFRHYFAKPERSNKQEILNRWRSLAEDIKKERRITEDSWLRLKRDAEKWNLELQILGKIPNQTVIQNIFYAAIREALTNTVKHTKGTKVMCRITEAGGKMCIEIENDGESPKKPIIEGGGLGNLRRMVQGAGGIMDIQSQPVFKIKLELQQEEEMKRYKVMIIDDQEMARQLFAWYFEGQEDYVVVCQAGTVSFVEEFVKTNQVDVVIMDVLMKDDVNGFVMAKRIKKICPQIKIVMVTSMPEVSWINKAKNMGIDSFWYKEASQETILSVVKRTMAGERVYPNEPPKVSVGQAFSTEITERELEVLRVMTKGSSNAAIARELGIAENTVKQHIRHMMEKTGCESRTELAIEARLSGVVVYMEDQ